MLGLLWTSLTPHFSSKMSYLAHFALILIRIQNTSQYPCFFVLSIERNAQGKDQVSPMRLFKSFFNIKDVVKRHWRELSWVSRNTWTRRGDSLRIGLWSLLQDFFGFVIDVHFSKLARFLVQVFGFDASKFHQFLNVMFLPHVDLQVILLSLDRRADYAAVEDSLKSRQVTL